MTWKKSSYCGAGECVEIALDVQVHVRDTAGRVIVVDRAAWAAFLGWLR